MSVLPQIAYRGVKIAAKTEFENIRAYDMPWRRRLWLYRHGFISSRGVIYDLSEENVEQFVNEVQAQKARPKYHECSDEEITDNKLLFHLLLSQSHPQHIPDLLAAWDPDRGVLAVPGRTITTLEDLLSKAAEQRLVMKPKTGWGGDGVHLIESDDGTLCFDGTPVSESELRDRLDDQSDAIFTTYVTQAAYAERIYPDAANTLRILVMVDPETDSPFIASAVHRFGTAESGHVDNWSSGGLSVHVDRETGELGRAAASPKGSTFERLTHHPDTGERLTGTAVPSWDSIREGVLAVADDYKSMLSYAGWDIVVTDDDGSFTIVEGNAVSDLDLLQTHEPLLTDERVERFYRHHGVL